MSREILTPAGVGVLLVLYGRSRDDWADASWLAAHSRMSFEVAKRTLRDLERNGWLTRSAELNSEGRRDYRLTLRGRAMAAEMRTPSA